MSSIEKLATYITDGLVVDRETPLVRMHVVDTLAAWAAGAKTHEGRMLIALRAAMTAGGVGADIALHTALARLSEIDDIHLASMTTPGSIVVPAALTIAASLPEPDGRRLAAAIVAGYEAMTRLGLAIDGPAVLYRGIWPTYFAAPFGTAAVAAKLLGLDAKQTAHALALALTLAAPGVGHHNSATTTRWLAVGNAARNGWHAALGARAGFTADLAILDGAFLKGVFQISTDVAALTRNLCSTTMLAEVSFKPWCGARQTMAAVQAVKELLAEGLGPRDITAITASVLPPHLKMIDHGVTAGDRASHLTSLPYQMALAVLAPQAMSEVGQSPVAITPDMAGLMGRIEVVADDGLLAGYPAAWSARVSVTTASGQRERLVSSVPGDPSRPWSEADVKAKLVRTVAPVAGGTVADALYSSCSDVLSGTAGAASVIEHMRAIAAGVARQPL